LLAGLDCPFLMWCFGIGVILVSEVGEIEAFFSCESFHEE